MNLVEKLRERREAILEDWFDAVAANYPLDTLTHLKDQKDQFSNPVGHTFRQKLPVLFDGLCGDCDESELAGAIDELVKIRTVQASSPSQAVAFGFLLKNVIRWQGAKALNDPELQEQLVEFEAKIDGLVLMLFDQYMKCQIKIYQIKANEAKMRSAKLVEQINKRYGELPDDLQDDNEANNDPNI